MDPKLRAPFEQHTTNSFRICGIIQGLDTLYSVASAVSRRLDFPTTTTREGEGESPKWLSLLNPCEASEMR